VTQRFGSWALPGPAGEITALLRPLNNLRGWKGVRPTGRGEKGKEEGGNEGSGVAIGCARHAVHAGPSLWGAQTNPVWGRGWPPFESLHTGPIQP